MKNNSNQTSFVERRNSFIPRAALLTLFALALAAIGGWQSLTALADVVPGGYVQVQPNAVTLTQGTTQQLRAAVLNPLGFELPNRKVTWSSSNPAVGSVNDAGLVTAVAPGTVTITAKSGAAVGIASVTVNGIVTPPPNTAPTVTITAPTDGATFVQGNFITFTGNATDLENGNLTGFIRWTATNVNDTNVIVNLGNGASVSSSSLAPGSYLVTARVTDSGGLAGVAQIGITVNSPCSITASLTPASSIRLPQIMELDARASFDSCNRPLKYFWGCTSTTNSGCAGFITQANSNNNTTSVAYFQTYDSDSLTITLKVCVADTNECAPQLVRQYTVASGFSDSGSTENKESGPDSLIQGPSESNLKAGPSQGPNFQRK